MRSARCTVALLSALMFSGCTHFPENAPIETTVQPDRTGVYSFDTLLENGGGRATNSEKIFVILAFSGGGVRASAFSFGVLEKLRDVTIEVDGVRRSVLDEVDVIVSNSGGSYTSAYYAAYRETAFGEGEASFNHRFLYANFQSDFLGAVLPNVFRLASPGFNRSDLAAEILDEDVFHGKRFEDLIELGRPYVVINATDDTKHALFTFTQEQFDNICSDLSSFKLARAVLASSAVNGVFGPVRLVNYPDDNCTAPVWLANAYAGGEGRVLNAPEYAAARADLMYREKNCFDPIDPDCQVDTSASWYVHLSDGGAVDNRALRPVYRMVTSSYPIDSILNRMNPGQIENLVLISVNSASEPSSDLDRSLKGPNLIQLIEAGVSSSMDAVSADSQEFIDLRVGQRERDAVDIATRARAWCNWLEIKERFGVDPADGAVHTFEQAMYGSDAFRDVQTRKCRSDPEAAEKPPFVLDYYPVWLSFDDVGDVAQRRCFKNIKTRLELPADQVDALRELGPKLLNQSDVFTGFLAAHDGVSGGSGGAFACPESVAE